MIHAIEAVIAYNLWADNDASCDGDMTLDKIKTAWECLKGLAEKER